MDMSQNICKLKSVQESEKNGLYENIFRSFSNVQEEQEEILKKDIDALCLEIVKDLSTDNGPLVEVLLNQLEFLLKPDGAAKDLISDDQKKAFLKSILGLIKVSQGDKILQVCFSNLNGVLTNIKLSDDMVEDLLSNVAEIVNKKSTDLLLYVAICNYLQRFCKEYEDGLSKFMHILPKLIFPPLSHSSVKVREVAEKTLDTFPKLLLYAEDGVVANVLLKLVKESYCKELLLIFREKQEQYVLKIWRHIVNALGKSLHRSLPAMTPFFQIIERGFKSVSDDVCKAAFLAWKSLISNFALDEAVLNDSKKLRFVLKPFKNISKFSESVSLVVCDTWWHLAWCLSKNLSPRFTEVCLPLLEFTIGRTSASGSVEKTPIKGTQIFLAKRCCHFLIRILEQPPNNNFSRISSPKKMPTIIYNALQVPIDVKVIVHHSKEILLIIQTIIEIFGNIKDMNGHLDCLLKSMLFVISSVIEDKSKESSEAVVLFINLIRNISEGKKCPPLTCLKCIDSLSKLPRSILISRCFNGGAHNPQDILCTTLLKLLMNPYLFSTDAPNKRLLMTYNRLIQTALCETLNPLLMSQKVIHIVKSAFTVENIDAEILFEMWSGIASPLLEAVEKTQEVNQGDKREHDFSCLYDVLLCPFEHIFPVAVHQPRTKPSFQLWTNLYKEFVRCASLVSTTLPNEVCEHFCAKMKNYFKDDLLKEPQYFENVCSIIQIVLESVDFTSMGASGSQGLSNSLLFAKRKKPLGNLTSLVDLLSLLLSSFYVTYIDIEEDIYQSCTPKAQKKGHITKAAAPLDLLKSFISNLKSSCFISSVLEQLVQPLAKFYSLNQKRTYTNALGTKLENLWNVLVSTIEIHYLGPYDSDFLSILCPLLEPCISHPRRIIKERSRRFWFATFAPVSSSLKLPESLKTILKKSKLSLMPDENISSIDDFSFTQDSESLEHNEINFQSAIAVKDSFAKPFEVPALKVVKPVVKNTEPKQTKENKNSNKKSVDELPSSEFVIINSPPPTTPRRRSIRQRKSFVPALYNDLSQSQDTTTLGGSSESFDTNSSCEIIEFGSQEDSSKKPTSEKGENVTEKKVLSTDEVAEGGGQEDVLNADESRNSTVNHIERMDVTQDDFMEPEKEILKLRTVQCSQETVKNGNKGISQTESSEKDMTFSDMDGAKNTSEKSNDIVAENMHKDSIVKSSVERCIEQDLIRPSSPMGLKRSSRIQQKRKSNIVAIPSSVEIIESQSQLFIDDEKDSELGGISQEIEGQKVLDSSKNCEDQMEKDIVHNSVQKFDDSQPVAIASHADLKNATHVKDSSDSLKILENKDSGDKAGSNDAVIPTVEVVTIESDSGNVFSDDVELIESQAEDSEKNDDLPVISSTSGNAAASNVCKEKEPCVVEINLTDSDEIIPSSQSSTDDSVSCKKVPATKTVKKKSGPRRSLVFKEEKSSSLEVTNSRTSAAVLLEKHHISEEDANECPETPLELMGTSPADPISDSQEAIPLKDSFAMPLKSSENLVNCDEPLCKPDCKDIMSALSEMGLKKKEENKSCIAENTPPVCEDSYVVQNSEHVFLINGNDPIKSFSSMDENELKLPDSVENICAEESPKTVRVKSLRSAGKNTARKSMDSATKKKTVKTQMKRKSMPSSVTSKKVKPNSPGDLVENEAQSCDILTDSEALVSSGEVPKTPSISSSNSKDLPEEIDHLLVAPETMDDASVLEDITNVLSDIHERLQSQDSFIADFSLDEGRDTEPCKSDVGSLPVGNLVSNDEDAEQQHETIQHSLDCETGDKTQIKLPLDVMEVSSESEELMCGSLRHSSKPESMMPDTDTDLSVEHPTKPDLKALDDDSEPACVLQDDEVGSSNDFQLKEKPLSKEESVEDDVKIHISDLQEPELCGAVEKDETCEIVSDSGVFAEAVEKCFGLNERDSGFDTKLKIPSLEDGKETAEKSRDADFSNGIIEASDQLSGKVDTKCAITDVESADAALDSQNFSVKESDGQSISEVAVKTEIMNDLSLVEQENMADMQPHPTVIETLEKDSESSCPEESCSNNILESKLGTQDMVKNEQGNPSALSENVLNDLEFSKLSDNAVLNGEHDSIMQKSVNEAAALRSNKRLEKSVCDVANAMISAVTSHIEQISEFPIISEVVSLNPTGDGDVFETQVDILNSDNDVFEFHEELERDIINHIEKDNSSLCDTDSLVRNTNGEGGAEAKDECSSRRRKPKCPVRSPFNFRQRSSVLVSMGKSVSKDKDDSSLSKVTNSKSLKRPIENTHKNSSGQFEKRTKVTSYISENYKTASSSHLISNTNSEIKKAIEAAKNLRVEINYDELTNVNTRLNASMAPQTRRLKMITASTPLDDQCSKSSENDDAHGDDEAASLRSANSILKKRKAAFDIASPKHRKVRFADPLVEERLFRKDDDLTVRIMRNIIPSIRRELNNSLEDTKKVLNENSPTTQPTTATTLQTTEEVPSSSEYQSSDSLNDYSSLPVSPLLINCEESISCIVKDLTSPTWVRGLETLLISKNIKTIGDLARLNMHELKALPFKSPKVLSLHKALAAYLQQSQEAVIKKLKTVDDWCSITIAPKDNDPAKQQGSAQDVEMEDENMPQITKSMAEELLMNNRVKQLPTETLVSLSKQCFSEVTERLQNL